MANSTGDVSLLHSRLRALRDELERVRQRDRRRLAEAERRIEAGTMHPPTSPEGMHELFQAYEERAFVRGRLDALSGVLDRLDRVLGMPAQGQA
ncbi:MAG: hypothetical protein QJR03_13355 [Sphaerobacter sp.]|nr:hypothetical protein [Sphaerobacter sp.]